MGNQQMKVSFRESRDNSARSSPSGSRHASNGSERGLAIKNAIKSLSGRGTSSPRRTRELTGSGRGATDRGLTMESASASAVSSFLLAASSFVHAVQAERGASCIYSSSGSKKLDSSLKLLRAVSDEMMGRLAQTSLFSKVQALFTWDEMDILRLRVDSQMPFTECYNMFTLIIQRLLDMIAKGLDSLRQTSTGAGIASYTLFMAYKEYVGRERAFGGGIISGGGKFESAKHYTTLMGIKTSQVALSRTFVMTASRKCAKLYTDEVSVLPEELAEFSQAVMLSQTDAERAMEAMTSEFWFQVMSMRMDVMEHVQKCLIDEVHDSMGIKTRDGILSAPLIPALERTLESQREMEPLQRTPSGRFTFEHPDYGKTHVLLRDAKQPDSMIRIELKRQMRKSIGGTVYEGSISPSRACAVKVCDVAGSDDSSGDGDRLLREFIRELSAVGMMRHPNIIKLIGSTLKPPRYAMVLEHMDRDTLWDTLRRDPTSVDFMDYALQLASGVQYIHKVAGLMHRNLKTPNLLLNSSGRLKISQLGLCCLGDEGQTNQLMEVGTLRWMAPEVLLHRPYGQAADIYSVGIILWELLTKQPPWTELQAEDGKLEAPAMAKAQRENLRMKFPPKTPLEIAQLILRCVHPEPFKRPHIDNVKKALVDFGATATDAQRGFLGAVHPPCGLANFHFLWSSVM